MNIYALSSGRGPSGIAIVRISGKDTLKVCKNLTKLKEINSNEVATGLVEGIELDTVLSNSFGFGGTNASIALSKFTG